MNTSLFYHHPEGVVTISNGAIKIDLSLQEFLQYEPNYSLPEPNITRTYIPEVKHILSDGSNQTGDSLPWKEGDFYIENVQNYINQHNNHPDTIEAAKNYKTIAVDHLFYSKSLGGVVLADTVFSSSKISANLLISFSSASAFPFPKDFYVKDQKNKKVKATLNELYALNSLIEELHYYCSINADNLKEQIQKLKTIEEIESFNINVNWPEVPFKK